MIIIIGRARRPLNTWSLSQPQTRVPGMAANSYAKYAQPALLISMPFSVSMVGAQSRQP